MDLRWARTEEKLSLRHSRFRNAILDIASTLLNRSKESLDSEHVRVYKRNRLAAYTAVVVILSLAVGATIEGVRARRSASEAGRQKDAAIKSEAEPKREEGIANSGRLAAMALLHKNDQFDLASLLSIEGLRTADTFEARNALFTLFEANPSLAAYLHHPATVNSVAFSPDGKTLATGGGDGVPPRSARTGMAGGGTGFALRNHSKGEVIRVRRRFIAIG